MTAADLRNPDVVYGLFYGVLLGVALMVMAGIVDTFRHPPCPDARNRVAEARR